jgi:hypothetical protein
MISIIAPLSDGASVEIGVIGNEGMFGVSIILGDDTPSQRAIVQLPGTAMRSMARRLRQGLEAVACEYYRVIQDKFDRLVEN